MRVLLLPFAWLYTAILRFRHWLYDAGILRSRSFGVPYIILGNLELGGSGKTPHASLVIGHLENRYQLGLLSRGYGRITKGPVWVESTNSVEEVGDELCMLRRAHLGIRVLACEDRVVGMQMLIQSGCEVIVLDDAFQHRRLGGGFRVLLTPSYRPFWKEPLIPSGRLRDIPSRWRSADAIVRTKHSEGDKNDLPIGIRESGKPLFCSSMQQGKAYHHSDGTALPDGYGLIAFSGLADNQAFFNSISRSYELLDAVSFSDHHVYTAKEVEALLSKLEQFDNPQTALITTEKDAVRLETAHLKDLTTGIPLYVLPVKVRMDKDIEEFLECIDAYVEAIR